MRFRNLLVHKLLALKHMVTYCPETIGSQIISSQTNGSHTMLVHTSSSFPMIGHKLLDLKLLLMNFVVFSVLLVHTLQPLLHKGIVPKKVINELPTKKLTFNHIHKLHISPVQEN